MKQNEWNPKINLPKFDIRGMVLAAVFVVQTCLIAIFLLISLDPDRHQQYTQTVALIITGMIIDHLLFLAYCHYSERYGARQKLRHEQEKLTIQLQQSDLFLKALDSTYREFRNSLQVMLLLATQRKNDSLKEYITSFTEAMTRLQTRHTQNPVLNTVIYSHKILAREKKINLVVDSSTPFHGYFFNFHLLTALVSLALERMVENEINSQSFTRAVFLNIKSGGGLYHLDLYNSSEAVLIFKARKKRNYKPSLGLGYQEKALADFGPIDELIKRLQGRIEYIIKGDTVVQLKIKISKK